MALVSKILETTLTAGSTSVTFTDADIPNSLIRVFSSNSDVIPESRILSGTSLTVVYAPQTSNMDVALEMVKQGLDIVDNVLSEDTDKALSAKQGKLLKDGINNLSEIIAGLNIPDNITDLNDIDISDIENGQVLAWDAVLEKFVNVDQSGTSQEVYTTDEAVIGSYLGKPLYRKVVTGLSATATWQGTYYPNVTIPAPISNVKEVISSRAIMNYSEGLSRNSICSVIVDNNNSIWALIVCDDITVNTLIVEYTKTTD